MKAAIVTGGTRGIGRGVVEMLVKRGYRVFLSYAHDEEAARRLEDLLGDNKVITFQADHSMRGDTYRFIDFIRTKAKSIDCIVCNAGITIRKEFDKTTDHDWDSMMEVGVNSHVILLRELFDITADKARIIFTGSAMGIYPHATVVGYGVVKSTVHALVRNLVKVYEPKQATVNAIAPGFVDTEWQKAKPNEIRMNINRKTAAHRFAEVEEVVKAFEFCIDNSFVNGDILKIDGGYCYE